MAVKWGEGADFAHLRVDPETQVMFADISQYNPHEVDLNAILKVFVPDYVPWILAVDQFLKFPPPYADGGGVQDC